VPQTSARDVLVERLRAAGCVFAEDEADVLLATTTDAARLDAMVRRRAAGAPLEQVVGWVEFCGLRLRVGAGVFVPRRRTEHLARAAAARTAPGALVVDLCTGTGAVGLAVRSLVGEVELHLADVDAAAVAVARANADPGVEAHLGDLFAALPERLRGRIDTLTANVPYVPTGEVATLPTEAREHEPRVALDGGGDGLAVLRRVAEEAPRWLRPGAVLLSEVSAHQSAAALAAFAAAGLAAEADESEEHDATVVIGTRPR
jgi:release factor glutamine methyltransferase